jgi:hypothetical protein
MQFTLKVHRHPSGRHTLTEQTQLEMTEQDCKGDLFGNLDAGEFYRAVAMRLNELHNQDHVVNYIDYRE